MRKIVFLAVLLCACGGGGGGGDDDSSSTDTTPTATTSSAFGAGTHLLGQDIASGRYYSDPRNGCYWERLSGLGGTSDEIIANEFISFDSQQEIVDIYESDLAFSTDGDCGEWFTTPRYGMQIDIPSGNWLVGSQITPGTYRASVGSGCYWERLSGFSGLDDIIANDFMDSAGSAVVSIAASDVGFSTDGDCGTWSRIETVESGRALQMEIPPQSLVDIENNWRANRQQEQIP